MAGRLYFYWYPLIITVFAEVLVNGHLVNTNEANSSPSHIIATKGSSVWLHWNYTYIGDTEFKKVIYVKTEYKEQVIGINSASLQKFQPLAKRIGQNGDLTLESPVPAPFNGRVEAISSNSTIAIHNLQYNDSTYQLSSNVKVNVDFLGGQKTHLTPLEPMVTLTIQGTPDFIEPPPSTIEVDENSNLQFTIFIDGNPMPSVSYRWSHLTKSSWVQSVQLYPFVYTSTYTLKNISGSYCGRFLETATENIIGPSSTRDTIVTVFLNLEQSYHLKIERHAGSKCIMAKWKKVESGKCQVKYTVKFKNSMGKLLDTAIGYNIGEKNECHSTAYAFTSVVELSINFRGTSKTVTAVVSEEPTNITVLRTLYTSFHIPHSTVQNAVHPTLHESVSTSITESGAPRVNGSDDVSFQPENPNVPGKPVPVPEINAGENNAVFAALVVLASIVLLAMVIYELVNHIRRQN